MVVQQQFTFDYSHLAPDVRGEVQEHTRRLHELERRTAESLIEMGEHLIAVNEHVGRYQFQDWLKKEFSWSQPTASRLMAVAREFGSRNIQIEYFARSALYALTTGDVPEEVREAFIGVAEAGRPVRHKDVQEAIAEHRSAEEREAFLETQFVCDECGELFSVEVWHCENCDHHWSEGDDICKNCYVPRHGGDEDDEPAIEGEYVDASDVRTYLGGGPSQKIPLGIPKNVHVSNNSGENEWYTPPQYIDAVREVLGTIDLDPASNPTANGWIQAERYFTKDDNGLAQEWHGRVFMNPPYAQPLIFQFCEKMVGEVAAGRVTEAIVLVNNATETRSWQAMAAECASVCFPQGRIKYFDESGKPANTPLQGQSFVYFGERMARFADVFRRFGVVR